MNSTTKLIITFLLLVLTCSVQAAEIQPRIIGGQPAGNGEWPATVALLSISRYNSGIASGETEGEAQFQSQFCGASLLTPKWVLTAAHCVDGSVTPASIYALTGATDLLAGGSRMVVANIIVHPAWNPATNDSDIALLELAQNATTPAQTIPLFVADPAVGTTATVVGWGARNFDPNVSPPVSNNFPTVLEEVEVPVVAQSTCNAVYAGAITNNMICAGFAAGSKDSCQGDSGGPLMAQQGGVFRQIGIVSFGSGCALPDAYGVYTRVDEFSNWVVSFTGSTGSGVATTIAPTANAANQTAYPVGGTCTAGNGNVTVSIVGATQTNQSITCSAVGNWDATFNVSNITDGSNVIDVNASQTDAVGNTSNAPLVEADKDVIAPVVATTIAQAAIASTQNSYQVSGSCTGGDGDVTVSIAGASPPSQNVTCTSDSWSATFNVSSIADGSNVIDVNASQTDAAGNTGTAALVEADKTIESGGSSGAVSWLLLPLALFGLTRRRFFKRS